MTQLALVTNTSVIPKTYVNAANSNVITNTTTETAFDQVWTTPNNGIHINTLIRLRAAGVFSTGLLNLGFTFRIRWGGIAGTVIASSGGISLASSLSDGGWFCNAVIVYRNADSAGSAICQADAGFQAGAVTTIPLSMPNTSTFAVDNTIQNDIVLTCQWNVAAAANSIQMLSHVLSFESPSN